MARHRFAVRMALPAAALLALVLGFEVASLAGPPPCGNDAANIDTPDIDNDCRPDVLDNCVYVKNNFPLGCDVDQDGYGNMCDGDFNEDATVDGVDFGLFKQAFKTGKDTGNGTDHNCDTAVDGSDFGIFKGLFEDGQNGVSGLGCANPTSAGGCPNSQ